MSKQKSLNYSPYFLLYGREPLFPSKIQDLESDAIDLQDGGVKNLKLQLDEREESKSKIYVGMVAGFALGALSATSFLRNGNEIHC